MIAVIPEHGTQYIQCKSALDSDHCHIHATLLRELHVITFSLGETAAHAERLGYISGPLPSAHGPRGLDHNAGAIFFGEKEVRLSQILGTHYLALLPYSQSSALQNSLSDSQHGRCDTIIPHYSWSPFAHRRRVPLANLPPSS